MKEERSPPIFFLIAVIIMTAVVILLWPYLIELIAYIGLVLFLVFIILLIFGIAALIAHLILIPFFAVKNRSEIQAGDYHIEDAEEPGKDEKA